MKMNSRRTLLKLLGLSLPSAALSTYAHASVPAALRPMVPKLDPKEISYVAVREWLFHFEIDSDKLDSIDKGKGRPTRDLRRSFKDDPVLSVGGLLLPTGFCRYCLKAPEYEDKTA